MEKKNLLLLMLIMGNISASGFAHLRSSDENGNMSESRGPARGLKADHDVAGLFNAFDADAASDLEEVVVAKEKKELKSIYIFDGNECKLEGNKKTSKKVMNVEGTLAQFKDHEFEEKFDYVYCPAEVAKEARKKFADAVIFVIGKVEKDDLDELKKDSKIFQLFGSEENSQLNVALFDESKLAYGGGFKTITNDELKKYKKFVASFGSDFKELGGLNEEKRKDLPNYLNVLKVILSVDNKQALEIRDFGILTTNLELSLKNAEALNKFKLNDEDELSEEIIKLLQSKEMNDLFNNNGQNELYAVLKKNITLAKDEKKKEDAIKQIKEIIDSLEHKTILTRAILKDAGLFNIKSGFNYTFDSKGKVADIKAETENGSSSESSNGGFFTSVKSFFSTVWSYIAFWNWSKSAK